MGSEAGIFFGWLNRDLEVIEEENELLWSDREQNYFDMTCYAGEGNMGHIYGADQTV